MQGRLHNPDCAAQGGSIRATVLFVFPIVKFIVYRLLKSVKVVNANQ